MNEPILRKSVPLFFIAIGVIVLSVVFFACSIQPSNTTITVTPTVSMKNTPKDINSIELKISGDGMETITESIGPGDEEFEVEVPAGVDRTFELTVVNPSVTFTGSTTEDLVAGEEVEIEIFLNLLSTKTVIPEADESETNSNPSVIQVDDLSDTGWIKQNYQDYGFSVKTDFRPSDIDFDSQGRIYIANDSSTDGIPKVIRVNSISDTAYETVVSSTDLGGAGVPAIAIDRVNHYLYYSTGSSLIYRKSLVSSIGAQESFDITAETEVTFFSTFGFAVDSEGYLYLANNYGGEYELYKYDPSLSSPPRMVATQTTPDLNTPNDILILSIDSQEYVVVANGSGAAGYKIIVFNTDLSIEDHFFSYPSDPDNPTANEVYFPQRFVAILSDKITFIDEETGPPTVDRIVQTNDINGNGWKTYGSTGNGIGQFYFYNYH